MNATPDVSLVAAAQAVVDAIAAGHSPTQELKQLKAVLKASQQQDVIFRQWCIERATSTLQPTDMLAGSLAAKAITDRAQTIYDWCLGKVTP